MRVLQVLLLLAFLGAMMAFAIQNTQGIIIRFLDWKAYAPAALVIVAAYVLGMLTGWTLVAFLRRTLRQVAKDNR